MRKVKKLLAFTLVLIMLLTQTAAFAQFVINPGMNFQPIQPLPPADGGNITPIDPNKPIIPELPGETNSDETAEEKSDWDHTHAWSEWEIIKPAGETGMGKHKRTCQICGVSMSESFYSESTLYRDIEDREEEVIKLQEALIEQGYLKGKADGLYGQQTQNAVRRFQRNHGFRDDGIAWDPVLKALYEVEEVHLEITDVVPPFARCAGETTASVANEGYSVTGVSWLYGGAAMAADELFVEGEIYTVQVSLLASEPEGKEYTASINGESAAVAYEPDGAAIAVTCAMVCSDGWGDGAENGMEGAIVSVCFERISALPASLAPGQSAKVTYRATNDGTAVLRCSWFGIDCGAERAQKDYGKLNGGDRFWFLPGDSFTFEQQINVSDQDIANGSIKRTLLTGGEIWVSKSTGEIIVMANQAEMNNYASRTTKGTWSVSDGYEIPLVSKAPVHEVSIESRVVSTPEVNPEFYVPGEDIRYDVVLNNQSETDLINVVVKSSLSSSSVVTVDRIGAGETFVCGPYSYQATFDDAVGPLVNNVQVSFTYEDTQTADVLTAAPVEVWIGLHDGMLDITKTITNAPTNGSFFTEGETIEYAVTISNGTNQEMRNVVVTDQLTGGSGSVETTLFETSVWEKDASQTLSYSYTVTAADVALGSVTNSALIHAENNIGLAWESVSEDVTVPVGGVREVLFETRVISTPEVMPGFYVPGETIYYEAVVTNNSNAALLNAEVETSLLPGAILISSDRIEAGETLVCGIYTYQATFDDAVGPLVNTSQLTFTYEDTQTSDVRSSSAEVWIGLNDGSLEITKSIANAPANGSFFTEGETIEYVITCTNATNEAMFDVVVTDMMTNGSGYSETILSSSPAWAKGVCANTGFSHTVTAEDVALGSITNSALIHAVNNIGLHWETESEAVTALTGVAQTPAVPGSSEESKSDTVPETPANPKQPAEKQKPAASSDEAGVPLWLNISGTPVDGMVDRSPFATSASLYQAQLSGDEETGMVLSAASDEALGNQIIYIADLEDSGVFSSIGTLFNFEADPVQTKVFFGPKNAQEPYQIAALMRMNVSDEPFNLTNMTDLTNRAVYKVYQTALSMAPVRLQNVEVAYGDDMLTLVVWDQVHHGQCLVVVAKKQ